MQQLYRQAKQALEQFSDTFAATVATISLYGFLALLLGAIAAWGGGMLAAKSNPDLIE